MSEIKPGQIWITKHFDDDPFKETHVVYRKILEIKNNHIHCIKSRKNGTYKHSEHVSWLRIFKAELIENPPEEIKLIFYTGKQKVMHWIKKLINDLRRKKV